MQEELRPMEDTMAWLYDKMILIQVLAPIIGIQKKAKEVVKILKVSNRVVNKIQEWATKYSDASQYLEKKDKIFAEMDRVQCRLHLHKYLHLGAQ